LEDGHECIREGVEVVVVRRAVGVRLALLVQVHTVVIRDHHHACETLHAQQREDVDDQHQQHGECAQIADGAPYTFHQDTQRLVGLHQFEHAHQAQCTQSSELRG